MNPHNGCTRSRTTSGGGDTHSKYVKTHKDCRFGSPFSGYSPLRLLRRTWRLCVIGFTFFQKMRFSGSTFASSLGSTIKVNSMTGGIPLSLPPNISPNMLCGLLWGILIGRTLFFTSLPPASFSPSLFRCQKVASQLCVAGCGLNVMTKSKRSI